MNKSSKNLKDTKKIAKQFLIKMKPNKTKATVVGLYGDLGTGKTTFVQFLAKQIGIKRKVNSPTFVIMKKYSLAKQEHRQKFSGRQNENSARRRKLLPVLPFKFLYHIDAYRLKNEKELIYLDWQEIVSNKEHLVFIEWPENIKKALPKKHHKIHISHTKEGHRKFMIKAV